MFDNTTISIILLLSNMTTILVELVSIIDILTASERMIEF